MRCSAAYVISLIFALFVSACGGTSDPAELMVQARQSVENGDHKTAIIHLKQILTQSGDNAEARWLLGSAYLVEGDLQSAAKELQLASDYGHEPNLVTPALARVYNLLGSHDEVKHLEHSELSDNSQAIVLAAKALASLSEGQLDAASNTIGEALEMEADSAYVLTAQARIIRYTPGAGNLDKAREVLGRVIDLDAKYAPAHSLLADIDSSQGDLQAAEESYSNAIANSNLQLVDRLKRASVRISLENFEGAQKDLDTVSDRVGNSLQYNYLQGLLLFSQGNQQESLPFFEKAYAINTRHGPTLYFLAQSLMNHGNAEKAYQVGTQYYQSNPEDPAAQKLMGRIELARGNAETAESILSEVLQARPDDIEVAELYSSALAAQGKFSDALENSLRLVEMAPQSSAARVSLGAAYLLQGDQNRGIAELEQALRLDSGNQKAEMLLIRNYMEQQDYTTAIAAAERFRDKNPQSPVPLNVLGRIYIQVGDNNKAKQFFEEALQLERFNVAANIDLAKQAIAEKDFVTARRHYSNILENDGANLAARMGQVLVSALEKNEAQMLNDIEAAMESNPNAAEPRVMMARQYLLNGQQEKIPALFVGLPDSATENSGVLEVMAAYRMHAEQYSGARDLLQKLAEKRPQSADVQFQLSRVEAELKNVKAVRASLQRALDLDPDHFRARLALAKLDGVEGKLSSLEDHLEKLSNQQPESLDVLRLQFSHFLTLGKVPAALNVAEKIHAIAPTSETLKHVAQLKLMSGQKGEAVAHQEEWLRQNPTDVNVALNLGAHHMKEKRWSKAKQVYEKVLDFDKDNLIALNNLSWVLLEIDSSQAVTYANRAFELRPSSAEILDTLAWVQYVNGDTENAYLNITKAADRKPEDTGIRYHKAVIAAKLGKEEEAVQTLQQLLKKMDQFPEKQQARELLESLI